MAELKKAVGKRSITDTNLLLTITIVVFAAMYLFAMFGLGRGFLRWQTFFNILNTNASLIITAIGQHDEGSGTAVDPVSAALILADKTDVRRNRVRNQVRETFDKHDQVNYAALSSKLKIDAAKKVVTLEIELDETICSMMDYFEIFLQRMLMCKRAAERLGLRFKMTANGNKIC